MCLFSGEKLMKDPLSSVDHIESKCEELRRTSALLIDKIQKRNLLLTKARELMDRIDKVNLKPTMILDETSRILPNTSVLVTTFRIGFYSLLTCTLHFTHSD